MNMALAFRHDTGWSLRRLIARVTGAPVHVALFFGNTICIEADGSRVRQITQADRVRTGQWTVVPCDITPEQAKAAHVYAVSQLGKPYSWWGVLFAWWAGRWFGVQEDAFFCSKLAAASLLAARVPMQPARAAYWTPRRLFDWCASWR